MQIDQREALDDPRPTIGVMAHAYPPASSPRLVSSAVVDDGQDGRGGTTRASSDSMPGGGDKNASDAEAAATELVIDALLAVEAETIGPEVRLVGLPRGTDFPPKKPNGGAWRGPDGLRVMEGLMPEGLVKRGWLRKHSRELPGSLVYFASVDVSTTADAWAVAEDVIVADLRAVIASLAVRDVKVLLVLVRTGAGAGQTGGREEREVADERALSLRRRAEVDARFVVMVNESELASRNNPPSVRRISKVAKDMAVAHYAAHISRLRRWEKVLVPARRMYRPLLTRLYFKLGVLHEMQGIVDRSVLCYQEVAALLSELVPKNNASFISSGGGTDGIRVTGKLLGGADSMEQIRGVAEVVHLRLLRNHLHRNMSIEGAIRQLRRHVAAFGRAPALPANFSRSGGAGGGGTGVVTYRHHAWLSRQYLTFGEMLGEHLSQFPMPAGQQSRSRGDGGGLGYASPGYYYLSAALQAVRRRKTSERLLAGLDTREVEKALKGLEVQEALHLGESVRLVDPEDPQRDLQRERRAFLDLEESRVDRAETARSLLTKALERLPADKESFKRRRVLLLAHLGEESFVSGRYEDVLERLPSVWNSYMSDGWLQLAAETLRRVYVSAWRAGKAGTVAHTALRLAGKALWPWVTEDERKRLLTDALPLVGAAAAKPALVGASGRGGGKEEEEDGVGGKGGVGGPFVESSGHPSDAVSFEVVVNASRLVMRLSGKFDRKEASPGDGVTLTVGLLSLLPVEATLDSLELAFNDQAFNCTVRNTSHQSNRSLKGDDDAVAATVDLSLAYGMLRVDVPVTVRVSGEASSGAPATQPPLRLVGARAIMRDRDRTGVSPVVGASGLAFTLTAGTAAELAGEEGGSTWATEGGWESLLFAGPRARAHVSIAPPPPLLLGALTPLMVTVAPSAHVKTTTKSSPDRSGTRLTRSDPFADGLLFFECEPAPVPPPEVTVIPPPQPASSTAAAPSPADVKRPAPSRPRAERAFFWAPFAGLRPETGEEAVDEDDAAVVSGFLPMVVGNDGQPVSGLPLRTRAAASSSSAPPSNDEEVTIPVWVRSETAGKVTVRARVVYGTRRGDGVAGRGSAVGRAAEGVIATEWARAEVLCVRPLSATADVIALQDHIPNASWNEDKVSATGTPRGYTVAVKTTITNLQEKSLEISRMEIVPPPRLPASPSPPSPIPSLALSTSHKKIPWARLPNGPVIHDDAYLSDDAETPTEALVAGEKRAGQTTRKPAAAKVIALARTGDSYTCCFLAAGDETYPSPLGRLRVTWKPKREAGEAKEEGKRATKPPCPVEGLGREDVVGGGVGAVTDFPLPVLAARPPVALARLRAPPYARVGEEFSIRWEISNPTKAYSSFQLTAEEGGEFVWSGKRQCALQVAPSETVSVTYRLVPLVPGHVLLPKVAVVSDREKVNIVTDLSEGRSHIFVRP